MQALRFANGNARADKSQGVCSTTTEKNARKIIAANQEKFISEGKYIFISAFSGKEYDVGIIGKQQTFTK